MYRPRMQVCDERGRGPCKSQPDFVQNGFKICSIECLICFFSDELKMKMAKNQHISSLLWHNWCIYVSLDDVL